MISKAMITEMYDYLRLVHKTTREVIRAFPDDKMDWAPAPGMRTPRDLVEHIYGQGVAKLKAIETGHMTLEEMMADHNCPGDVGAEGVIRWADERFEEIQRRVAAVREEQCAKPVEAFFGTFPGGQFLSITYDEWWHHRGQLTVYLRLLGIEVPCIYDYEG